MSVTDHKPQVSNSSAVHISNLAVGHKKVFLPHTLQNCFKTKVKSIGLVHAYRIVRCLGLADHAVLFRTHIWRENCNIF